MNSPREKAAAAAKAVSAKASAASDAAMEKARKEAVRPPFGLSSLVSRRFDAAAAPVP